MKLHSRGISGSHFLARNVKCVKCSILMLLSFISSLVLSSCIASLIHFLHLHCASALVHPALDRPFNISAGQAGLSQLGSATDVSSVCSLKYYTDKILRITIVGQASGGAHTASACCSPSSQTLPAQKQPQLDLILQGYFYTCNAFLLPKLIHATSEPI